MQHISSKYSTQSLRFTRSITFALQVWTKKCLVTRLREVLWTRQGPGYTLGGGRQPLEKFPKLLVLCGPDPKKCLNTETNLQVYFTKESLLTLPDGFLDGMLKRILLPIAAWLVYTIGFAQNDRFDLNKSSYSSLRRRWGRTNTGKRDISNAPALDVQSYRWNMVW